MELTTILGLIIAILGVLGGMIFKGVPFSAWGNPAAIFIILVGTLGAVLNAFPMSDIKKVPKLFGQVFGSQKLKSNQEIINQLVEMAQIARKEGLIALEGQLEKIEDPFFKRGIELLLTGQNKDYIEDVLTTDIEEMEQRHHGMAGVFTQAGTYAPTLGVLGAVIGLIAAMGLMQDQEKLAHAISGAFMATVYGIFTGYVVWHPFANKLKRKSKAEALQKTIIMRGIILMEEGLNYDLVRESLISYLPSTEVDTDMPKAKGDKDSE